MPQAHSERGHALLGASKADQWLNCPPSARLQENIAEKRSSFADEGTAAHELAEMELCRKLFTNNPKDQKSLDRKIKNFKETNQYYNAEMENAVQGYAELVEERFMEAKAKSFDAILLLEQSLDFSEWVPEGYGTGDVVIVADGMLEVIDLKYGKGIPVSAQGNPQLRLYALGAWLANYWLYSIKEVIVTIIQPRLDNISTDIMPLDDLLKWADTVVKPAAKLAFDGTGEFKSGEHCRWCKAKGNCRARAEKNMEALEYEFQDPALLSLDEIGPILYIAEQLQTWAKDIQEYALDQAKAGSHIAQWKLVEGRSTRAYKDKEGVKTALLSAGYKDDEILKPQEPFGITDLEKKIGKKTFKELLGDLIVKPQGKPTLVPETDKRPEMNSIENDFENIDMEVE